MTVATSPTLPTDYWRGTTDHKERAALMKSTGEWVHISDYANRPSAQAIASQIRNGRHVAYPAGHYNAYAITTIDGTHQVWGQYRGIRGSAR